MPETITSYWSQAKDRARTLAGKQVPKLPALAVNGWLAIFLVSAIAAPELAFAWSAIAGIYLTVGSMLALLALAIQFEEYRKLAVSAALLPLAIMVNLSLPQSSPFGQAVVFYDTLLLLTLVYRHMFALEEPVQASAMTFRGYLFTLPSMIVAGQLLGIISFGLLRHQYQYSIASISLVAAISIVFAVAEEMFFRGLLQQRASKLMHPAVAAVITTLIASLALLGHATPLIPLAALLNNAVTSYIYYKKPNLVLTITVNAVSKLLYLGLLSTFVLF